MIVGAFIYVLAWLLPALKHKFDFLGISSVDTYYGWNAFLFTLTSKLPDKDSSFLEWYAYFITKGSALSNFIMTGTLLDVFLNTGYLHPAIQTALFACAVLNTIWLFGENVRDLRIGYYLWVGSFFLIAAALATRSKDVVSWASFKPELIAISVTAAFVGIFVASMQFKTRTQASVSKDPKFQRYQNTAPKFGGTNTYDTTDAGGFELNREEFARRLQGWKQELIDDVISYYLVGDSKRGRFAFSRWKERFTAFLKENIPDESIRFEQATTHFAWIARPSEHPYDEFLREDGETCFAFIDDLADSILKGRLAYDELKPSKRFFNSSPRIFLSYAREDIDAAKRLFEQLKASGADVCFDKEFLLPGQKWKVAIRQAIQSSRFFLALLSNNSVTKKGFVQKELKQALEILDEYPEPSVFIIPIRLNNCVPSDERLRDLHWVDMFPDWDAGFAIIIKAIESEM
jgi:hypothetical protein